MKWKDDAKGVLPMHKSVSRRLFLIRSRVLEMLLL